MSLIHLSLRTQDESAGLPGIWAAAGSVMGTRNRVRSVRWAGRTGPRALRTVFLKWFPALALIAVAPSVVHALTIAPIFDSSITNHPQASAIEATIRSAIATYEQRIVGPGVVTIEFRDSPDGLGASLTQASAISYTDYLGALRSHASSRDDAVALSHLPDGPGNPVNGNPTVIVSTALARALGLGGSTGTSMRTDRAGTAVLISTGLRWTGGNVQRSVTTRGEGYQPVGPASVDGTIELNTSIMNLAPGQADPGRFSLLAVAFHEIDEVLGFGSALNGLRNGDPVPTGPLCPEDLFRYDASGNRTLDTDRSSAAYFSLDGANLLARFNQYDRGDFSDWFSPGGQVPAVQDAFATSGATPVPGVELRVLDAIGYALNPGGVMVDSVPAGQPQNGSVAMSLAPPAR